MNKFHWATICAGLFAPSLFFFLKNQFKKMALTTAQKNLKAFLLMIQYSEGTSGTNAYRILYGGGLFNDFSAHPNLKIKKYGITSTAAGAYQILNKTWKEVALRLKLTDFSPINQDRAAIELIRRRKALEDVLAGRFSIAIEKCKKEWASLPGSGYGQHENSIKNLLAVYQMAGGAMTA